MHHKSSHPNVIAKLIVKAIQAKKTENTLFWREMEFHSPFWI